MKNKKILFLFVAVIVLCLSTALFAACNKNDTPPSSKGDFKEGDVIVDKNENTVTEKEYDEAGREVREISHVETLYNVTYLANDASVIYLKGNKSDECTYPVTTEFPKLFPSKIWNPRFRSTATQSSSKASRKVRLWAVKRSRP